MFPRAGRKDERENILREAGHKPKAEENCLPNQCWWTIGSLDLILLLPPTFLVLPGSERERGRTGEKVEGKLFKVLFFVSAERKLCRVQMLSSSSSSSWSSCCYMSSPFPFVWQEYLFFFVCLSLPPSHFHLQIMTSSFELIGDSMGEPNQVGRYI